MVQEGKRESTIITVFSTASAVGKTVLAINLAAQLVRENFRVCIVDLDLQFGDVCHYLKLQPKVSLYDYQENPDGVVDDFLVKYNEKLAVLAAPTEIEESYNIETPVILRMLDALREQYEFIILDTVSGFSDINLVAMDLSDVILFMGILDFIPTIKNMKIGHSTMLDVGYAPEKIRFVLNRSNAKKNISIKDVEAILGVPFYHSLPNEFAAVIHSIRKGVPLASNAVVGEYGQKVGELTDKLLSRAPRKKKSGWLDRLFGG